MRDTTGLPKVRKDYGSRGAVVLGTQSHQKVNLYIRRVTGKGIPRTGVRLLTTAAGSSSTVSTDAVGKLRKIAQLCKDDPKFIVKDKVYRLLYDRNLFQIAYNKLKSNPGNMTPGILPTTLDGMSNEVIDDIINKLRSGSFEFQPGRRVNIPKANGKKRPLTIAPRDKLVQECMRMILEVIYEPAFAEVSHGFRNKKSCHSALRTINQKFGMATWLIEGDITNCLPSINHELLLRTLRERIKDDRFIRLIRKSLKAGYFEFRKYSHSVVGTPQGSIISPILANVYLDKLDRYVMELKTNFDIGTKASINPEYKRLDSRKSRAGTIEEKRKIHKQMLNTPSKLAIDPKFKKLEYIRYADD